MENIDQAVTLMITGMIVLFAFMGIMIVILHYFQKIVARFSKKD